jgi:hypothetical protein
MQCMDINKGNCKKKETMEQNLDMSKERNY